jgi:hypothetical protein
MYDSSLPAFRILDRLDALCEEVERIDDLDGERVSFLARSWDEMVDLLNVACSSPVFREDREVCSARLQHLLQRIPALVRKVETCQSSVAEQLMAENRRMSSMRDNRSCAPTESVFQRCV